MHYSGSRVHCSYNEIANLQFPIAMAPTYPQSRKFHSSRLFMFPIYSFIHLSFSLFYKNSQNDNLRPSSRSATSADKTRGLSPLNGERIIPLPRDRAFDKIGGYSPGTDGGVKTAA